MKKITLITLLSLIGLSAFGQELWNSKTVGVLDKDLEVRFLKNKPNSYSLYSLNKDRLSSEIAKKTNNIIELPTPNGIQKFSVRETSVLSEELSKKYPEIKSYSAKGIDDPTATAKISNSKVGIHVMLSSGNYDTYYIDPYTKKKDVYISYRKRDLSNNDDFECLVQEKTFKESKRNRLISSNSDGKLRKYKLALACTGEYAQFHLTQQGISGGASDTAKKAAVLSAMNTTMTRVNGVFERDVGVTMEIVGDDDKIIYLNKDTDPFTDDDPDKLIDEVQSVIDTQIGSTKYDIGHVFSTGGGGVALLGSVCVNGQKAQGVTGQGSPINDPFDVDYVAHEMGHQFGANHTQNNNCQRNSSTAVEPGSASTIMGYAGICSPNVQTNSDDHFHAVSIAEMRSFITSSATCATITVTGNNVPTANAGADVTIPKSTPFVLKGQASDADSGNSLTYNWEQIDNQLATMPPVSTSVAGPLFRSLQSKTTPDRYFPDLATVIAGNTSSTWEVLPSVARTMSFAFTVRDNAPGGGDTARDDIIITVDGSSGPFKVTSQSAAVSYDGASKQTITWDVASTTNASVNCQTVTIKFSEDGGMTYPTTILAGTANDGSEEVTIPNVSTSQGRIMIEADGNVFYAINSANISVNKTTNVENVAFENFSLYPNPAKSEINLSFKTINSENVAVKIYDIRGKMVETKNYTNVSSTFSEKLNVGRLSSGLYLMQIINGSTQTTRKILVE